MLKDLEEDDFYIICVKTFTKCFAEWIQKESYEIKNIDGVHTEVKTRFLPELNKTNTKDQYNTIYRYIKKHFLKYNNHLTLLYWWGEIHLVY